MTARIYRPAPNAMQSGRGKSKQWVLVFEQTTPRSIDPLMGYTSSSDMNQQIRLSFDTQEDAVAYAQRNNIAYSVQAAHDATRQRVSYPDNFRSDRKTPWTH
ncbi:MAG: ETC complex I subunit [Pelagibacterium sp. SCN 63-23]|nr:MAG: ETC complex I subunit [Pelagibacterium sp. SCN 63-23]